MDQLYSFLFILGMVGISHWWARREVRALAMKPAPPPPRGRYLNHWTRHLVKLYLEHAKNQKVPLSSRLYPYGDMAVMFSLIGLLILCVVLDIEGNWRAEKFIKPLICALLGYPVLRLILVWVGKPGSGDSKGTAGLKGGLIKSLGDYDCLEQVGSGAFGTVYRAVDRKCPEVEWAVKEMHLASGSQLESLRQSFDREQKVLSWLDHPGVVGRRDFFAHQQSLVLVMEFVHGLSLRQLLQPRAKPFSVHVVLPIVEQVCSALVHLHGQKPQPIVFRDLKPANIMVDPLGNVKLVDFGICRVVSAGALVVPVQAPESVSDATEVLGRRGDTVCLGTPGYAAPEQYPESLTESDPRADIYALGVVMWELLTGQSPSKKPRELAPLQIYQPCVPDEVQRIVDRATALNRDQRYSSSRLLLLALQEAMSRLVDDDKGFEEFAGALERGFQVQQKQSLLPDSDIRRALTGVH